MSLIVQPAACWTPGMKIATIALDNNYQTGGYPLAGSDLGFAGDPPDTVFAFDRKGFLFDYDRANQKLVVYVPGSAGSPDSEVSNGTDLSAITGIRVIAFGHI